jgi:glycerol-3-phosphate dehydrogenase
MVAARPLLAIPGAGGRAATRGFRVFHHQHQGAPGFFSVVGGKTSTARFMAEKTADAVCAYLGNPSPCRTREVPLLSYRLWSHL